MPLAGPCTKRGQIIRAVRDQDTIDAGRTTAAEYAGVYVSRLTVTVNVVDKPGVQVSPETLRIAEGRSGGYNVKLNTAPKSDVAVTVSSDDTSRVTANPASLTVTPTNWSSFQRVTVNAKPEGRQRRPPGATRRPSTVSYWRP